MPGPHQDWDKIHGGRNTAGKESGHHENKHVPTGDINVGLPDLDSGTRPELHLYSFDVSGDTRHRFRARLHNFDKHALVIRVDPSFNPTSPEAIAADGDKERGLFVLETGEIVIKPLSGSVQRFEFTVENPGGGVGDYSC